jgi:hypothetical protein
MIACHMAQKQQFRGKRSINEREDCRNLKPLHGLRILCTSKLPHSAFALAYVTPDIGLTGRGFHAVLRTR